MQYSYAKLRGKIVEKFGSQAKFAEALGISTVAMSNKMNCKAGFSQSDMIQWGEKLEIATKDFGEYFFA